MKVVSMLYQNQSSYEFLTAVWLNCEQKTDEILKKKNFFSPKFKISLLFSKFLYEINIDSESSIYVDKLYKKKKIFRSL
jgi:hypothetical protein